MSPLLNKIKSIFPLFVSLLIGAFGMLFLSRQGSTNVENSQMTSSSSDAHMHFTCSMHPQIQEDEPGTCPLCGMDLIPIEGEHDESTDQNQLVYSRRTRALARIRTEKVRAERSIGFSQVTGRLEYDESTRKEISAWMSGRVDRLWVAETGAKIRKGQRIASLYSPQIFAAHQDLLAAKEQLSSVTNHSGLSKNALSVLQAARTRLSLFGLRSSDIAQMEKASEPTRNVPFRSAFSGVVTRRYISEGAYVKEGDVLFDVADVTRLWSLLEVDERLATTISVGDSVALRVDALPKLSLKGDVAFVDPQVNPQTRMVQVRVKVSNRSRALKPGMVVRADFHSDVTTMLSVPDSAVLFTGKRSVVFVEREENRRFIYIPREVHLGKKNGSRYALLRGIDEGERVVIRGAFVLDSDLQIRGGDSMMKRLAARGDAQDALEPTSPLFAPLRTFFDTYLDVQNALATDDLTASVAAMKRVHLLASPLTGPEAWRDVQREIETLAQGWDDQTLGSNRIAFDRLSALARRLLHEHGNPLREELIQAHCPMAFDDAGAYWLQRSSALRNPYFGASMLTCGSSTSPIEEGDRLPKLDAKAAK